MVRTVREADCVGAGTSAGWPHGRPPAGIAGERPQGSGSSGGGTAGHFGPAAQGASARHDGDAGHAADGEAGGSPEWPGERLSEWIVWYGRATRRWWALPPERYRHTGSLIEAGGPGELAERIRQIEGVRSRFDQRRDGPSRTGSADRRPRSYGGPAWRAGREADGRCRA